MTYSDLSWHVLPKPQRMWLVDTESYPTVIAFAFDQDELYWLTANGVPMRRSELIHTPAVEPA